MKSDINGCSTCLPGQENYEYFDTRKGQRIQYDYRSKSGKLFSCVAITLTEAREKKDKWLTK